MGFIEVALIMDKKGRLFIFGRAAAFRVAAGICCFWLITAIPAGGQQPAFPVIIAGGGASGTAAALQCARTGVSCVLLEETPWLGGMLTSAGVSAVDGNHQLPSGIWGEFRDSLYARYGGPEGVATGWVSNTLFEPSVGQDILRNLVAGEPLIHLRLETRVDSLRFTDGVWQVYCTREGKQEIYRGAVCIDATELGDLLTLLKIPRDTGMDSRAETGERWAPEQANDIVQDLTFAVTLKDFGPGADKTIPRPPGYDPAEFECCCNTADPSGPPVALIDCDKMLEYGRLPNGKYMINWPNCGNDYYANLIGLGAYERRRAIAEAKLHSLRFVYFLQNELGYRHLGIAEDEYPTADHLPLIPYHRESGRVKGLVRMNVNHILDPFEQPLYRTGIAVGDYPIDHHHKKNPRAPLIEFIQIKTPSFNVPMGAMLTESQPCLIVAEKSISVTNIVNGATRLQPVVLGIGQAAGALAALAVLHRTSPREVPVRAVQRSLLESGAYIMPFIDVPRDDPHFAAIQRIGATGILKGYGVPFKWANQTWFYPDRTVTEFELVDGLRPYFSALKYRYDASGQPLRMSYLREIISALGTAVSLDDLRQCWINAKLSRTFSAELYLNRREAAVLVDHFLRPFEKPVDLSGEVIKE